MKTNTSESIKELEFLIADFIKRRDWKKYHTPKNLAMSIAIEAAELMELFQWLNNEEAINRTGSDNELRAKISDELADIMIYCLSLSYHNKIDIAKAIKEKMTKNEKRFPPDIVSGKLGPYIT